MKKSKKPYLLIFILSLFLCGTVIRQDVYADSIASGSCGDTINWEIDSDYVLTLSGSGTMTSYSSYSSVPWYSNRSNITSIKVTGDITNISAYAFYGCSQATSISLPDSITELGKYAFYNCSAATDLIVPAKVSSIGAYAYYRCSAMQEAVIPEGVTSIESFTYYDCDGLTSVELPETVTSIGSDAFEYCDGLAEIDIPSGVKTIGSYAFRYCSKLSKVTFHEGLTTIGNYAFYNDTALTEIAYPSTVTSIGTNSFYGCSGITKVTFPAGITAVPANACYGMTGLTDVVYSKSQDQDGNAVDTVTSIGNYAFYNCDSLTGVELPKTVTSIGNYAYYDCDSLISLVLPENVTSIGSDAFEYCDGLTELDIPSGVKTIGSYAFRYCTALQLIVGGEGLTSIGSNAFYVSSEISTILLTENGSLDSYNWSDSHRNVIYVENSYKAGKEVTAYYCDNKMLYFYGRGEMDDYTADTIPWKDILGETSYVRYDSRITSIGAYSMYGSKLEALTVGSGVTSIHDYAYAACDDLMAITIGEAVTSIGQHAFLATDSLATVLNSSSETAGAYGWTDDRRVVDDHGKIYLISDNVQAYLLNNKLTISGYGTITNYSNYSYVPWKSELNDIYSVKLSEGISNVPAYAFYGCTLLSSVDLGQIDTVGNYAFYGCTALKDITVAACTIGNYVFQGCSSLQSVTLADYLESIGSYSFKGCSSLAEVNLEDTSITSVPSYLFEDCISLKRAVIPATVETIASYAFNNCEKLNTLRFEEGVSTINYQAFQNCTSLTSVKIPRSLTTTTASSGRGIFYGCSNLTEITFADKVRTIPTYLFAGLTSLKEITIPATVSEIGSYAFYQCTGLEQVNCPDYLGVIGSYAFYGCSSLKEMKLNEELYEIGSDAFAGCTALEKIDLPALKTLGSYAFQGCTALEEVNMQAGITVLNSYTFAGTAIKEISLPYTLKQINSYAFTNNTNLTTITIPENVSSINSSACNQSSMLIRGITGSQAESFATSKGYTFQAMAQDITGLTLDKTEVTLALNKTTALTLSVTPESFLYTASWTSEDSSIATVTVDSTDPLKATVKAVKAGSTKITATVGSKTVTCTVTVDNLLTAISLNRSYIYATTTSTTQLSVSYTPSSATNKDITWSSSDKNVATVSDSGLVTPTGNGTARITASAAGGTIKSYCFIEVKMNIPVTGISMSQTEVLMTEEQMKLSASVLPANASNQTITWSSSDSSIATVDQEGNVKKVADGKVRITARTADGGYTASTEVTVQTISVPVESIELSQDGVEMNAIGTTCQLYASINPSDADIQDITWTSSDSKVVTVDDQGLVTSVGGGTATVTARTVDGSASASCEFTVIRLILSMGINPSQLQMKAGDTADLQVEINPSDALSQDVTWYSTNRKVVTVDDSGHITAVADGKAYVKCIARDGSNQSAACLVTVGEAAASTTESQQTTTESGQTTTTTTTAKTTTSAAKTVKAPARVTISSLKAGKKKLTVKWKKISCVGYQIQYGLKKNFKGAKTVNVKASLSKVIKSLKKGKTYYVRIRAYNLNGKKAVYGSWSTIKKAKVK